MGWHTFDVDDLDRWHEYFEKLEQTGPYHDPDYVSVLEPYVGGTDHVAELFVYEDDDGFVYYPYYLRPASTLPFADDSDVDVEVYSDAVATWYYGGPLASPGATDATKRAFREAFEDHCVQAGIVAEFLRFDPNLRNDLAFPSIDSTHERDTVPVDLTQSLDNIWDGFEKRNRNAIRQGRDSQLTVEPARNDADSREFYDIYTNAMDAQDASEYYRFPLEFFDRMLTESDHATLHVVRNDTDSVVGGSMVVHDGRIAHDYLRASNPDYWDQRVNNLLCYEALVHAKETGHSCFDFQGGRPGVFKFKKSFSPDRREFHVGREIHLPDVYDQLVAAAADAGLDTDADFFPAYRVALSN